MTAPTVDEAATAALCVARQEVEAARLAARADLAHVAPGTPAQFAAASKLRALTRALDLTELALATTTDATDAEVVTW